MEHSSETIVRTPSFYSLKVCGSSSYIIKFPTFAKMTYSNSLSKICSTRFSSEHLNHAHSHEGDLRSH